ncbi:lipoprotein 17-related variable surface protein [Mycoplasmopsis columboralis]|uniref:ECM-binding protein homolog n=1 Tax=Mycoplasmopsis columboralis TaxID=171282 RepID=A0A449B7I7_9BACT|nr:lipoprotein 17-related variable surface protein [Mycoplasmopsis columboralis]VEU76548.1 ECM-binding protein homolog [Mycoplasmopsis columboralis]
MKNKRLKRVLSSNVAVGIAALGSIGTLSLTDAQEQEKAHLQEIESNIEIFLTTPGSGYPNPDNLPLMSAKYTDPSGKVTTVSQRNFWDSFKFTDYGFEVILRTTTIFERGELENSSRFYKDNSAHIDWIISVRSLTDPAVEYYSTTNRVTTGYKTEQQRLDQIINGSMATRDLGEIDKNRTVSDVTDQELLAYVKKAERTSDKAVISPGQDFQVVRNGRTITITYRLKSTRTDSNTTDHLRNQTGAPDIFSRATNTITLDGFLEPVDPTQETNRLNQIKNASWSANGNADYANKSNLITSTNLTFKDTIIKAVLENGQIATFRYDSANGEVNKLVSSDPNVDFEIRNVTFENKTNALDQNGTLRVNFDVFSKRPRFENVSVSASSQINGFKTEVQRLNELFAQKRNTIINNLYSTSEKQSLASSVTKDSLAAKLTTLFNNASDNAKVTSTLITSFTTNNDNGTITFTYKLNSTRNQLTTQVSSNDSGSITIGGFLSVASEQARIDDLNNRVTAVDYQGKENVLAAIEFKDFKTATGAYKKANLPRGIKNKLSYTITDASGTTHTSVYKNGRHVFESLNAYVKSYYLKDLTNLNDADGHLDSYITLGSLNTNLNSHLIERTPTSSTNAIRLNGFKTEIQRLTEILEDIHPSLEGNLFTADEKQLKASKYTADQVKTRLANYYNDSNLNVVVKPFSATPDDINGQWNITYSLSSTRDQLSSVDTVKTADKTFAETGFYTAAKEKARLDALMRTLTVDYSPKNFLLNWPTTFDPIANYSKFIFSVTDDKGVQHQGVFQNGEWVFPTANAKIVRFEPSQITNLTDTSGAFSIRINLQSTKEDFATTQSDNQSAAIYLKRIQGFITETQRLNTLIDDRAILNNSNISNQINNKNRLASSVSKDELVAAINAVIPESQKAQAVNDHQFQVSYNDTNGTINVSFWIVSKRDSLTDKKSNKRSFTISGFNTAAQEQARLDDLKAKITNVVYKGARNNLPSERALDYKQLEVTIRHNNTDYVAKYVAGNENKLVIANNPLNLDITDIVFNVDTTTNSSDRNGTANVDFNLRSNKSSFTNVVSSVQNKEIRNFKTEQQRLNELINRNLHNSITFTASDKNNLPSRVSDSLIKAKFLALFNNGANKSNPEYISINKDDQNGTITVTYKVKSAKTNLTDIVSEPQKVAIFNGFLSKSAEQQRIDLIAASLDGANFDYSPKTNTPALTSFIVNNLLWSTSADGSGKIAGNATNTNEQVKLTGPVTVSATDDRSGNLTISYKLASTKPGFEELQTETRTAIIPGFLTEVQRLNNILNAAVNNPENNTNLRNGLQNQTPSSVTKTEAKRLLTIGYNHDSSEIDLNSINLVANNANGTLKITYQLRSKRTSLTDVLSSDTKSITLNNLRSNASEKVRVNTLANQIVANYPVGDKTAQLTSFEKSQLRLTLNNEQGVWDASRDGFVFANQNMVVKDITFTEANDLGNNGANNTGSVKVNFKAYSTIDQYTAVASDAKYKVVSGFKTEQQRVNEVKTSLNGVDFNTADLARNREVSQVTNDEIIASLAKLIPSDKLATVDPNITVNRDNSNGTINVTWKVHSTRNNFNVSSSHPTKSVESFTTTLTGFLNAQNEINRLNNISVVSADYAQKQNLITNTNLTTANTILKFNVNGEQVTAYYDASQPNKLKIANNKGQFEIRNVVYASKTNALDENGTINLTFDLYSLKPGYENVKVTKNGTASGFKREVDRLNEVINNVNPNLDLPAALKTKPASSVTKADIANAITQAFASSKATFDNNNSLKNVNSTTPEVLLKSNDENGTLEIKYIIKSTRDDLTGVYSTTEVSKVFTGFLTKAQEKSRLDNLANSLLADSVNYDDKTNLPSMTTFEDSKLKVTIGSQTKSATVSDPFDAPINAIVVPSNTSYYSDKNDRDGSVKTTLKLKSRIFDDVVSEPQEFTINGFKTEAQRLDDVLDARTTPRDFSDSEEIPASTKTKQQVFDLLNDLYTAEDKAKIDLDSITLNANDTNGTLGVSYKLISLRDNLTDVDSTKARNVSFSGFKTTEQEQERLNGLLLRSTADYEDKTNTPLLTTKDKSKVIITIDNVRGRYDSVTDSYIFDAPVNAKAINLQFSEENDQNGTLKVKYDLVSTDPAFSHVEVRDTNDTTKKEITNFLTESQRLDKVIDNKTADINGLDFDAATKKKAPSTIEDADVIDKLNSVLNNTNSNVTINNIVGSIAKNNADGTITVTYKLNSTRNNLESETSSKTVTKVFREFRNENQVKTELNAIINSSSTTLDYSDKANLPSDTTFEDAKYTLVSNDPNKAFSSSVVNNEVVIDAISAKLESVDESNKNDKTGSVDAVYKLRSTEPGFENVVSDPSSAKTLSNFKTEQQRLDEEIQKHATSDNVNVTNKETRSPSEVTKAEIAKLLNDLYNTNANAKVTEDDITLTPNNNTGTLGAEFKLTSTKNGLTDVKSSTSRTIQLNSFLSADGESKRLQDLVDNHTSVEYNGSREILADYQSDQLSNENIKMTINGVVGTYNSRTEEIDFPTLNAKATELYFNNTEDRNGSLELEFKLVSTKPGLRNSTSDLSTKTISDFKTEKTRLSELVSAKETQLNNLQYNRANKKGASEFTKDEASQLLSTVFSSDHARVRVEDVQSIEFNNETGTATVVYKLNSARDERQLGDIATDETYTKVFTGFITYEQERQRLETALADTLENVDYEDKTNWPTGTTFDKQDVFFNLNGEDLSGLATDYINKVRVSEIEFDNKNDRNGTVDVSLTLTSTRPGFETVSVKDKTTVEGFATEVNRLNRVLVGETERFPLPVNIDFLSPNDKTTRAASTYTPDEIKALIQPYYDGHSVNIENLRLRANNKTGVLEATYTLSSTREGLEGIRSTQTKTHVMRGIKTEEQERQRLSKILEDINANIARKNNTPILSNLMLSDISLSVREVNGTLNDHNEFVFGAPVNAIAKNVTIESLNDEEGTVMVKVPELASTEPGFENVSSFNIRGADDNAGISREVTGFLTESQRLDKLVEANAGEVTYTSETAPKANKLPSNVTKSDLSFSKDETENKWYKLLPDDATLTPNDKAGTLTITLPITSTRDNLSDVKSTQSRTFTLEGFKTTYQDAIDKLNNLDKDTVSITNNNPTTTLPSSEEGKNKDNYTINLTNDDPNLVAEIVNVVGHDDVNGKTLVAYKLVDNNPDHTNLDGTKPESKVFYKVVDGLKTERDRLNELKDQANNNLTYSDSEHPKASTFPSDVQSSDYVLDNTFATNNKVSTIDTTIDPNNEDGTLTANYKLNTTKTSSELFNVDTSLVPENAREDLNNFKDTNFVSPTAEQFKVAVDNTKDDNGFLNYERDLDNKIQTAKNAIDGKTNISDEEKTKLKADLDRVKDTFKQSTSTPEEAYNTAKEAIETINNIATTTDNAKGAKIAAVDATYPHLNKAQRDQVKENLKNSNTLEVSNANLPTTTQVEQNAKALDNAMKDTKERVDANEEFTAGEKYTNAPQNLKDQYDAAIQAAKDLIPLPDNVDGTNTKVPVLDGITDWRDTVTKPTTSNYPLDAVEELKRTIDSLKETIEHLQEAKDNAKAAIDKLPYLSADEKADLKKQVDAAETVGKVNEISDKATVKNSTKEQKHNAVDTQPEFEHLNDAQKQAVKDAIINSNLEPITNSTLPLTAKVISDATELDDAMETLQGLVNAKDSVHKTPLYINATPNSKDVYDKLTEAGSELSSNTNPDATKLPNVDIHESTPNWTKESVDKLNEAIKNALVEAAKSAIDNYPNLSEEEKTKLKDKINDSLDKTALNNVVEEGKNLNEQKQAKINAIDASYPYLNQSQKDAVAKEIKETNLNKDTNPNAPAFEDVDTKASALNESMKTLRDLVADKANVLGSDFYNKATDSSKDKYNKLTEGASELANNNNLTDDQANQIEDSFTKPADANWNKEAVDKLNEAIKNALKAAVESAIDNYPNLSEEEKAKLKSDLAKATTPEAIKNVGNNAKQINTDKQDVIDEVNKYQHLNETQKASAINEIKQANLDATLNANSNNVADVKQKAKDLDDAMGVLDTLVKAKEAVHTSDKYNNATDSSKQNYDHLISGADQLLKDQNPSDENLAPALAPSGSITKPSDQNWDKDNVDKLAQAIKDALKQAAKDAIDKLPNLSDAEKEALKNSIDGVEDVNTSDIDDIVAKATNINDAKQTSIDKIKQLPYLSDDEKEKYIKDVKDTNLSDANELNEQALAPLKAIETKAKEVNTTKKGHYDAVETNYPYLNDSQKAAVKEAIIKSNLEVIPNKETTPSTQNVLDQASALNESMKTLREFNDKAKSIIDNNELGDDVSAESKDKFSAAQAVANALSTNTTPDSANVDKVDTTISNRENPNYNKSDVDKVVAKLAETLKKVAEEKIDHLPNLSEAEKTALKEQLNNPETNTVAEIDAVLNKAKTIDNVKKDTIDAINKLDYLSDDEKAKYIKDVKDTNLSASENPAQDPALSEKLQEAQNTNNTKKTQDQNLNLEHVNQAQRDAITQAIKDSNLNAIAGKENTPATAKVIENAEALDNSMKTLRDLEAAKNKIITSPLYAKATPESQDLYDKLTNGGDELIANNNPQASNLANTNINETSPNWSKASVDTLNDAIIHALKEAYKGAIDKLEHLSQEEKTALKDQLDNPQTTTLDQIQEIADKATTWDNAKAQEIANVETNYPHLNASQKQAVKDAIKNANWDATLNPDAKNVAQVKAQAQELDDSMAKLQQFTNDDPKVVASPMFTNASEESKTKYQKAIEASKQLQNNQNPSVEGLNGIEEQNDANWPKDPVDKLTTNLEDALKEVASSYVDNLPNLSEAEKTALKNQINAVEHPTLEVLKPITDRAQTINDKKQKAIDVIVGGEYLSQAEKDNFQKQVKNTNYSNPDQDSVNDEAISGILSNSNDTNNTKKEHHNNIDNLDSLNDAQKTALKDQVIKSNLNAIENSNNEPTSDVVDRANALNESMKTLKDFVTQNPTVITQPLYTQASEETKDKYDHVSEAGSNLINNIAPTQESINDINSAIAEEDKKIAQNNTPNWDKANVDKLNADLLDKYKDLAKEAIDKLPYLSQQEKTALKDKLDQEQNNTKAKVDEILDLAKNINSQKENIANKIKELPHLNEQEKQNFINEIIATNKVPENPNDPQDNSDLESILDRARKDDLDKALEEYVANNLPSHNTQDSKAKLSEINDLIKAFEKDDQTNNKNTNYNDYKQVTTTLDKIASLKEAYDAYLDSNVANNDAYKVAKEALDNKETQVQNDVDTLKDKQYSDPRLQNIKNALINEANKDIAKSQAEKEIVDALVSLKDDGYNSEHFNEKLNDALAKMNAAPDSRNNQVIAELENAQLNYPAMVEKSNNNEGLDDAEFAKLQPLLDAPKSNVVASALEHFGPYRANLNDEDKNKFIANLNDLEYLSPKEKQDFINQINHAVRTKEAKDIIAKANEVNDAKKAIADQIRNFEHLNDSQKQAYINEVKANPLVTTDPQSEKSMDQILKDTQELDDKMLELQNALQAANELKKSDVYTKAKELNKMNFDEAIVDGLKVTHNEAPKGFTTPNLNKGEVQSIIDRLKLQAQELAKSAIDKLPYVLNENKDEYKEQLSNTTDTKKQEEIIKKAESTNDLIKQIIDTLKDLAKEATPDKESHLDELLDKLAQTNPNVDPKVFNDTKDAIYANAQLSDFLKAYRDSDINDETYLNKKEALTNALNEGVKSIENKYSQLNDLVTDLVNTSKTLNAQGRSEIDLVDALIELNKDKFNSAMVNNQVNGRFNNYDDLADKVNAFPYFDVLKKAAEHDNKVTVGIYQLVKDANDEKASNVIKSALKKNFDPLKVEETLKCKSWWACWWWYVVLSLGSISVLGLVAAAAKKFQESNPKK